MKVKATISGQCCQRSSKTRTEMCPLELQTGGSSVALGGQTQAPGRHLGLGFPGTDHKIRIQCKYFFEDAGNILVGECGRIQEREGSNQGCPLKPGSHQSLISQGTPVLPEEGSWPVSTPPPVPGVQALLHPFAGHRGQGILPAGRHQEAPKGGGLCGGTGTSFPAGLAAPVGREPGLPSRL